MASANSESVKISVVFVCLGNICRSPMAEAVFRSLTKAHPGIAGVDSAGTGAYHAGDPPDPRTMETLLTNNIADYDHEARKIRSSDFTEFDYVLAMDQDNLMDLKSLRARLTKKDPSLENSGKGKVMLFSDFGGKKGEQVGDPYYGAKNGFAIAYDQMVRFSKGFISEILDGTNNTTPEIP